MNENQKNKSSWNRWYQKCNTQFNNSEPIAKKIILRSDIVGAKSLIKSIPDDEFQAILDKHAHHVYDVASAGGGKLVGRNGDAVIIGFEYSKPTEALLAAIRIHETGVTSLNSDGIYFTSGIATGEVIITTEGYLGPVASLAYSLSILAASGAIFIDEETDRLVDWNRVSSIEGNNASRSASEYKTMPNQFEVRNFENPKMAVEVIWSKGSFGTKDIK